MSFVDRPGCCPVASAAEFGASGQRQAPHVVRGRVFALGREDAVDERGTMTPVA